MARPARAASADWRRGGLVRADCHMSRDGTYTPGAGSGSGYHQGAWANRVAVITGVSHPRLL